MAGDLPSHSTAWKLRADLCNIISSSYLPENTTCSIRTDQLYREVTVVYCENHAKRSLQQVVHIVTAVVLQSRRPPTVLSFGWVLCVIL